MCVIKLRASQWPFDQILLNRLTRRIAGVGPAWCFKQAAMYQWVIRRVSDDGVAAQQCVGVVGVGYAVDLAQINAA